MKGLFDCLRNKVYREDEDILKQIAANAAMDDTEIEAFEADDEDDEDELFDFAGLDLDDIDDADIERVTNEFNMDEGNRAACRIKTIDIKEDAEIYDEGLREKIRATKEARKQYKASKNAALDKYGEFDDDNYKRQMDYERKRERAEEKADREYFKATKDAKKQYKAAKKEIWRGKKEDVEDWELNEYDEDNVEFQPETKLNKKVSLDPDGRDFVGAGDGSGHDMKNEAFDLIMEEVRNEIEIMDEANVIKKTGRAMAGYVRGAYDGAAEGMKKGSDFGDDLVGGGLGKAVGGSIGQQAGSLVGGIKGIKKGWKGEYVKERRARKAKEVAREEGVSLDEALEYVLECEQDLLDEGFELYEIYGEDNVEFQPETRLNKKISLDPDGRDFVGAGDGSGHDMKNEDTDELLDEVFDTSGAIDVKYKNVDSGNAAQAYGPGTGSNKNRKNVLNADGSKIKRDINMKKVAKGAAIGAGVAGAAYGAKKLYDHMKAKKAQKLAMAEGISLDEALAFVEQCEQDLLAEGFTYEEIYGEDNVEFQPETRLVKKVSTDDDMREFVGASKGAQDNLKTEAAILAYEEGITLEEAMAWLLEDEEYDEDAVDDAIAKLGKDGNNNGVFPNRLDLQDEVYDEEVYEEGEAWNNIKSAAADHPIVSGVVAGVPGLAVSMMERNRRKKAAEAMKNECGDADECAPKRQHQAPVGDVTKVSVDGVDTDDELMLGVEAVIQEIEESLNFDEDGYYPRNEGLKAGIKEKYQNFKKDRAADKLWYEKHPNAKKGRGTDAAITGSTMSMAQMSPTGGMVYYSNENELKGLKKDQEERRYKIANRDTNKLVERLEKLKVEIKELEDKIKSNKNEKGKDKLGKGAKNKVLDLRLYDLKIYYNDILKELHRRQ